MEVGQDSSHDGDTEDVQEQDLVSSGYERIVMAYCPLLPRLKFNARCLNIDEIFFF